MERYEAYKDSGVEWVDEVPASWVVQRFRWTLERVNRLPLADDEIITCFRDGEVTLRSNRREDGFTMSDKEIGYQHICAGDFVIHGMDGFAGAMGISDSDGKASPVLMVFRPIGNHDLRYINYLLRLYAWRNVFLSLSTTIRVRSCDLNWAKVAPLPMVLPNHKEQQAIADYLDAKTAEIDALVADCEREVELLREYRKAVISEAVTKGLDPDVPMKDSGIEWIGAIPKNWVLTKTLYGLSMPITDGPHETPDFYDEGIPFISAEAVSCGNGRISFDHMRGLISQDYYEECCKKYVPQRNDVYMIKSGATTGRVAIVDTDRVFTIWSPLAAFRCDQDKLLPRYLLYFLQSEGYQKQVEDGWTYGTQQNIGMRTLERLLMCYPHLSEQRAISDYLDDKTTEIDSLIDAKQQIADKLREYRRSLISEAVTGKFKVPGV